MRHTNGYRRPASAIAAASMVVIAAVVLVTLRSTASAGLGEASVTRDSVKALKDTVRNLNDARVADPREQLRHIFEAEAAKKSFVESMFTPENLQRIVACDSRSSRKLFFSLEDVDLELEMALVGKPGKRSARVKGGGFAGRDVAVTVETCPGADEGAKTIAREIATRASRLADDGKLGDEKLKRESARIAALKRRLLGDQTIYDCSAFRIYSLVKNTDLALLQAEEEEGDRDRRDRLIGVALRHATELSDMWKRAPCETVCSDGRDNDNDDLRDRDDPGCLAGPGAVYDRSDQSEQHHDPGPACGPNTPMAPGRNTFIQLPNSGSRMIRHVLRNATDGTNLLEKRFNEGDFTTGGPVEVQPSLCGPGTTTTVEWVRNGTAISWHLNYYRHNAGVVPPTKQIVVAADTR